METTAVKTVTASKLREEMVVVDPEFHTPLYQLDHKARGSHGDVAWHVWNLETGRFDIVRFRATLSLPVAV